MSAYVGPLSFSIFAVPAGADLSGAVAELHRLRDAHTIEILDIELVVRSADGSMQRMALSDAEAGTALAGLASVETGLLHDDDLAQIGVDLGAGERALVVVYEDRSLAALASQITGLGGREVWSGGIDAADLEHADDSTKETS